MQISRDMSEILMLQKDQFLNIRMSKKTNLKSTPCYYKLDINEFSLNFAKVILSMSLLRVFILCNFQFSWGQSENAIHNSVP